MDKGEMDWLEKLILDWLPVPGEELINIRKSAIDIAAAIREEIRKLSILRFLELEKLLHPDWNTELEMRKEELRHFLKALGISDKEGEER